MSKTTDEQREEIIKLRNQGKKLTEIGEQFGITRQRVHQIIDGLPKEKRVCKYCGGNITFGEMCSHCYNKLKLVRELLSLCKEIKAREGKQ